MWLGQRIVVDQAFPPRSRASLIYNKPGKPQPLISRRGGGIIPWRGGASLFKLDNRCVNTVFFRKIVISFEWAWNLGNMYLNDHCSWIVSILKYNSFNTNKIIIIFNLMLVIFLNVYDSLMFLRVIVFSEILNSD